MQQSSSNSLSVVGTEHIQALLSDNKNFDNFLLQSLLEIQWNGVGKLLHNWGKKFYVPIVGGWGNDDTIWDGRSIYIRLHLVNLFCLYWIQHLTRSNRWYPPIPIDYWNEREEWH